MDSIMHRIKNATLAVTDTKYVCQRKSSALAMYIVAIASFERSLT
jgi:hypothetical protein